MKLKQLITQYTPFRIKEDVYVFFDNLQMRNTFMNENLKEKLLSACEDAIKPYLQERLLTNTSLLWQNGEHTNARRKLE